MTTMQTMTTEDELKKQLYEVEEKMATKIPEDESVKNSQKNNIVFRLPNYEITVGLHKVENFVKIHSIGLGTVSLLLNIFFGKTTLIEQCEN